MECFRVRTTTASSVVVLLSLLVLFLRVELCSSLNDEGRALLRLKELVEVDPYGSLANWIGGEEEDSDPCSWFGVRCEEGRIVSLNLEDLHLKGKLSPEVGKLVHLKYLILHGNFFYGGIPNEIGELQKLEVLDLGYNNFNGAFPSDISKLLSLEILMLSHNQLLDGVTAELMGVDVLTKFQVGGDSLVLNRKPAQRNVGNATIRRLLQKAIKARRPKDQSKNYQQFLSAVTLKSSKPAGPPVNEKQLAPPSHASPQKQKKHPSHIHSSPSPAPTPKPSNDSRSSPSPAPTPKPSNHSHLSPSPPPKLSNTSNSSSNAPTPKASNPSSSPTSKKTSSLIYTMVAVGVGFFVFVAIVILLCRAKKVVAVKPWATGLSGPLQRAFVTGVPSLKRSEIVTACEDFSNIIGSLVDCTIYKGTLSSGVEIAVTSAEVKSAKDWSKHSETQFRKKIATLSKINHKNFVNLLGYCEEEKPIFTRMMVFEYAPNGTLHDHLHIKEVEELGWAVRLRIAMGIAYCLEHMEQSDPPVILKNLDSSSIYLTDDCAAKISDFALWSETKADDTETRTTGPSDLVNMLNGEGVVYRYGLILLELLSGRLSYSEEYGELNDWASEYLKGEKPLKDMIDPMLNNFRMEVVTKICYVIRSCLYTAPSERPTMKDVAAQLREITAVQPEAAAPRLSPLWWAELEIISTEA